MTISPGARLGSYEITNAIGAGGMGEVFRARDTRLNRDVAIKVLPSAFADDPERLARFTREAQTLASLNHPNIGAIYGIEDVPAVGGTPGPGSRALVMELVEGEDLSAQIARGPIPVAEALPIARQIAEALEAAHEQGIVHRDLKPANIKVRADGTVKVLDFGLAKAMDPAGTSSSNPNVSHSPTLTHQGTSAGMIIGTAAYMSPEQAKGRAVDKRADIWAFGVVLWEMLTGQRLFRGEDVSDTLAAVLRQDVDFAAVPAETPSSVRRLIARCLERDLKRRLRDIGEARVLLENPASPLVSDAMTARAGGDMASGVAPEPKWRRTLPWAVAAIATLGFVTALALLSPWRHAPAPAARALLAKIGAEASLFTDRGAAAILSPDGTTLAFAAAQQGPPRLFVRKLDQLQAVPLAGTDGAVYPFFSPDGQWIAFFASGKLKKVSVSGGAAMNLSDAPSARGGTWAEDDTIIFSPSPNLNTTLLRVPAAGGTPVAFGTLGEGAKAQRWPQALPGAKAVLYTESPVVTNFDDANIVVAALPKDAPAKAGPSKIVVRSAYYGRYARSGHLLYVQQGTLFAVPFDPVRLETTGPAVPAIEGLMSSASSGGAQVDVSSEGTVAYVPGAVTSNLLAPIEWIARDGKASTLNPARSQWSNPRFSPDGEKLALEVDDGKQRDIWVYDWTRGTSTQLTFDAAYDGFPVWTVDGKRIVFASNRARPGGPLNLYWVNADGTGEVTRLTDSPNNQSPWSWHPSGRSLAYVETRASLDLMILPMESDATRGWTPGRPTEFLSTKALEAAPMFSPDGRFIAYMSNEAADSPSPAALEVYVRQFPGPGGKWRVSTERGYWPRWSPRSRELLFERFGQLWVAPFSVVGDALRLDKPQPWSPTIMRTINNYSAYDVHPDGRRIAAAADQGQITVQDHVVIMSNFFEHLRKIAPVKK